jgi:hypothetical protein
MASTSFLHTLVILLSAASLHVVVATNHTKAFYILFANQIDDSSFPARVCQNGGQGPQGDECVDLRDYSNGVIITSPQNITAAHIAKVKAAVPGSRILAYWDFLHVPYLPKDPSVCACCTGHVMGDKSGRDCTTTYPCGGDADSFTHSLWGMWNTSWSVTRLTGGDEGIVCGYPGLSSYVWMEESATAVSAWLAAWLQRVGFDGLYLDGYVRCGVGGLGSSHVLL